MANTKKAAIELSISTIVIIVLAMAMLIGGLVLIRNIGNTATQTVSTLDDKVQSAIANLFSDEGSDVVVKLGNDHTAKINAGTDNFGLAIGARTPDGTATDRNRLKYKLSLQTDASGGNNCVKIMGLDNTKKLFLSPPIGADSAFEQIQGANAYARVILSIPAGTSACTQKVFVDVTDTKSSPAAYVGGDFFIVQVQKASLF